MRSNSGGKDGKNLPCASHSVCTSIIDCARSDRDLAVLRRVFFNDTVEIVRMAPETSVDCFQKNANITEGRKSTTCDGKDWTTI